MFGIRHIKFDSMTYVLHYKNGAIKREGRGLSFFYFRPNSSIVAIPMGSNDLPFIFSESTNDYQTVNIQGQISYKISDPKTLADVLDFTVTDNGQYKKNDISFCRIWTLIKRLFVVFLIYQITRLIFYYYNIQHFPDVSTGHLLNLMTGGLRFDLAGILYLNLLFVVLSLIPLKLTDNKVYQKVIFVIFITTNAIGYAFNIMDVFYFNYILKRSTVEVFMFAHEQNIGNLLWAFIKDFYWGFILWFVFVYLTYVWYKFIKTKRFNTLSPFIYYPVSLATLLLVVYFSIVGIRGGFTRSTRPISLNNAAAYTHRPIEMSIVLNTPFSIIRTYGAKVLTKKSYYSEDELNEIYTPVRHLKAEEAFTNQNVVVIIVESLAREYIGVLNPSAENGQYKGYTPFIDSLIQKSYVYTNALANGRKSIDALPSVIASVPSLVQPYITSPYATNKIKGLGNILKEKGYQTAFFHGGPKGSMGFAAFMKMAGHDTFYTSLDYPDKSAFDGSWGIWDEEYLQFTAEKLNDMQEPFLGSIFTLSSHHPFKIPKKYKGQFKKGVLEIHEPVQYTDFALKKFFATASQMPWYQHTIFVITADHCNQSYLPEYQSSVGRFAIPIIIFDPSKTDQAMMDDTITHQVDILPNILKRLNYSGDFVSFGNDLERPSEAFAVNYINQTWQILDNEFLLQFRADESRALYRYKTDKLLKNNLISSEKETVQRLERQLKAYIQQYSNRMIANEMALEDEVKK